MSWTLCQMLHQIGQTVEKMSVAIHGRSRSHVSIARTAESEIAYQLSPSQPAAVAQISLPARASPPFGGDSRMAVGAILLLVFASPSLPLLLCRDQRLHFLCQYSVLLLELSNLILPRTRLCSLQLIKQVIFRSKRSVLVANHKSVLTCVRCGRAIGSDVHVGVG